VESERQSLLERNASPLEPPGNFKKAKLDVVVTDSTVYEEDGIGIYSCKNVIKYVELDGYKSVQTDSIIHDVNDEKRVKLVRKSYSVYKVREGCNMNPSVQDHSSNTIICDSTLGEEEQLIQQKEIVMDNQLGHNVYVVTEENKIIRSDVTMVYKAGYCSIGEKLDIPCVIKLEVPADARLAITIDEFKIRTDVAKVIGIFPIMCKVEPYRNENELLGSESDEIRWSDLRYTDDVVDTARGWLFSTFEYRIGQEIKVSNFDPNLNLTCVPGIHVNFTQADALYWLGFVGVLPSLVEGYDYVENYGL
jgi:hypothetical protein